MRLTHSTIGMIALLVAAGCSSPNATDTTIQRDALPPKVSASLDARYPNAEILKLSKEKSLTGTVYEAEMKVEGRRVDAIFDGDGSFKEAEASIAADALPAAVREDIASSPQGDWTMLTIEAVTKGPETSPSKYEIILMKGGEKFEVEYAPDGKRLKGVKAS